MALFRKIFPKSSKNDIHPVFKTNGINSIIYEYLDIDAQVMMSFSFDDIAKTCNYQSQKALKTISFLEWVVKGNESEAKKWLEAIPPIIFEKGAVTDKSQRTFPSVSAFQYALWAFDMSMLNMFLGCINQLPQEEKTKSLSIANQQLIELEKKGLTCVINNETKKDSKHYDFDGIINILIKFIHFWPMDRIDTVVNSKQAKLNFSIFRGKVSEKPLELECKELHSMWSGEVGMQQFLMPAHLIQEYCHPTRSIQQLINKFYSTNDFKEEELLPRVSDVLYKGEKINVLESKDPRLGCHFALSRGPAESVNTSTEVLMNPTVDLQGIMIIRYLRVLLYNKFMKALGVTKIKPLPLPNIPNKKFVAPEFESDDEISRKLIYDFIINQ